MHTNKGIALLFFAIICCFSCKNSNENKIVQLDKYSKMKQINWLIGNWENNSKKSNFSEIWVKENDSVFKSHSFVTVNKDTVFNEYVNLIQRNDSILYIVSVKNQNNEKPVSFYMTKANNKELLFENPKHDFPTKIKYSQVTNDILLAEVYGLKEGKPTTESFPMKRKSKK